MIDPEGYKLVEKEFDFRTHHYSFIEDLGNGWCIYRQTDKKTGRFYSFELVKLKKQEEYTVARITVPKKWAYPGAEMWGVRGFTFKSIKECYDKFDTIQQEEAKSSKRKNKNV